MASRSLPVVSEGVYERFNACVHCGLCLPACPTYVETQDEADSPRGRIHLMKAAVDGRIGVSGMVFEHLDRCLVCRACETACPSGVVYHELIEAVRPQVAEAVLGKGRGMRSGVLQWMVRHVLAYPRRAGAALWPLMMARRMGLGGVAGRVARWMPGPLGAMTEMVGEESQGGKKRKSDGGASGQLAAFTPAAGEMRGSVVLLLGCVGSVVSEEVNRASVEVISRNGFDVHLLAEEPCCGAMAAHANDPAGAREFAVKMVDALLAKGGDYIVSPIAGCGAQLKSLDKMLEGAGGYEEKAKDVVGRMRDISEFLAEVGLRELPRAPAGHAVRVVTYHDPCHLAHAQGIASAPRKLLAMVPGIKVVPLAESDMCCGAAGTYGLNQPGLAERIGRRKVEHILETGAEELVTANVGCALQIARELRKAGCREMGVRHVVELLAEAYRRE